MTGASRAAICAALWLSLLCGCAAPARIGPIRSGESVAIVVAEGSQAGKAVEIHNQALGNDLSVGAGSGAVAGGLWGFVCGPFAPLCIPLGAAAGAVSGGVLGAAVGATGALPQEKSAQLRDRLSRAQQAHDLREELRTNLTDRAQKHWNLGSDASAFVLTVELQDMSLTSTRDERIGLVVRVLVSVRPGEARQKVAVTSKLYEYASPISPLAVWLDEQSDFLDTSLSSASRQIAAQIVSELALK